MEPETQIEVERKVDVDNDVEMKDEEGAVEEGPKVSLPWAFIDCEIDSLIELVGESFRPIIELEIPWWNPIERWTGLTSVPSTHMHLPPPLCLCLNSSYVEQAIGAQRPSRTHPLGVDPVPLESSSRDQRFGLS